MSNGPELPHFRATGIDEFSSGQVIGAGEAPEAVNDINTIAPNIGGVAIQVPSAKGSGGGGGGDRIEQIGKELEKISDAAKKRGSDHTGKINPKDIPKT